MKPVEFHGTVLRDGHQSLAATRMTTAQMEPALEDLLHLGYKRIETWGGATVDSCVRFLGENPFERLERLKRGTPGLPHGMLLRGQNLVGYAPVADDVVEAFCARTAHHGMDVFRIFDALNDLRNVAAAIAAVRKAGKQAEGAICYTRSPVHRIDDFIRYGAELVAEGCTSLCIKDMAGLLTPGPAAALVKGLREKVKVPIVLHTHETAGLGATTLWAAIDAGVDCVDVGILPFGDGTGQPDTRRMIHLLDGHARKPAIDLERLARLEAHFAKVYKELGKFTRPENEKIDPQVLAWQVPGGMLSNFRQQLAEQGMADRFEEVVREIPVVREALGWVPLVTPTSQIVGVQAFLNVKFGRWSKLSPQAAEVALGWYGRTPGPVDPELMKRAEKETGKPPIKDRAADRIPPAMSRLRGELAARGDPSDDDHVVLHAMFPQELAAFLKAKKAPPAPAAAPVAATAPAPVAPAPVVPAPAPAPARSTPTPFPAAQRGMRAFRIAIGGKSFDVTVENKG